MNLTKFNVRGRCILLAAGAILLAADLVAQTQQPIAAPEAGMYAPGQQMASLRPGHGLLWRRTSLSIQQADGPVLYQLIFNASGMPGTVPVFDTNPRHLTNSPIAISGGNVSIGGGSALSINGSSGIITFAPGQTFPGSGLPNLAGEVTGAPSATVVSNADPNDIPNAIVRRDGSGNFTANYISVDGGVDIPTTTSSSAGVIRFGGLPFVHAFGNLNTFVGHHAGNFTTTGTGNTGVGRHALENNTTGNYNAAFGYSALIDNTSGVGNSAFGQAALLFNTTGANNSAFGVTALAANTASGNSAFGASALQSNTTGNGNAAFGFNALKANTTVGGNSAFGWTALGANTLGGANSAFGYNTLSVNTTGAENSAFGNDALSTNTGSLNSAFGSGALFVNTTGTDNSAFGAHALLLASNSTANSAFGSGALSQLTGGLGNTAVGSNALSGLGLSGFWTDNIALGNSAGAMLQNGSGNIYIGNAGNANESDFIRIGVQGVHMGAFIGGIYGATSASGATVFVNSNGQLGTATSSRRYKEDIAALGDESDVLMKLRPVAFYYKPELDETHTRQYGLVAEEVAQVAPSLVLFDKDGRPDTVRYHFVNAMLLNEVQKQRRLIETQQKQNDAQQCEIEELRQQLRGMMMRLEAVEASSRVVAGTNEIEASR